MYALTIIENWALSFTRIQRNILSIGFTVKTHHNQLLFQLIHICFSLLSFLLFLSIVRICRSTLVCMFVTVSPWPLKRRKKRESYTGLIFPVHWWHQQLTIWDWVGSTKTNNTTIHLNIDMFLTMFYTFSTYILVIMPNMIKFVGLYPWNTSLLFWHLEISFPDLSGLNCIGQLKLYIFCKKSGGRGWELHSCKLYIYIS